MPGHLLGGVGLSYGERLGIVSERDFLGCDSLAFILHLCCMFTAHGLEWEERGGRGGVIVWDGYFYPFLWL